MKYTKYFHHRKIDIILEEGKERVTWISQTINTTKENLEDNRNVFKYIAIRICGKERVK